MKTLKDAFFITVGAAIITGSFYWVLGQPAPEKYQDLAVRPPSEVVTQPVIRVGGNTILVEIAETPEAITRGLSGRESLESGHGLLFIFETSGMYGFWMKEMNFPIDIIWLDEAWQVVGVARNAQPESYPLVFYPPSPVKYVLELPAGEAERLGIDTGSIMYLDR